MTFEHDEEGHDNVVVVHLSEDDQGLAAGQFAAFYKGRTCLGSGVILESWDDQGFPVCEKALEIAQLEDKSKLGKPVKIKVKPETLPVKESNNKDGEINVAMTSAKNNSSLEENKLPVHLNWLQKIKERWQQLL